MTSLSLPQPSTSYNSSMYLTGNIVPAQRINPGLDTDVALLLNNIPMPRCVTEGTVQRRIRPYTEQIAKL